MLSSISVHASVFDGSDWGPFGLTLGRMGPTVQICSSEAAYAKKSTASRTAMQVITWRLSMMRLELELEAGRIC